MSALIDPSETPVYELARITIAPEDLDKFKSAVEESLAVLRTSPECHEANILYCVEDESEVLLRVRWSSLEGHQRFRDSEEFAAYRAPIQSFFQAPPRASHYTVRRACR